MCLSFVVCNVPGNGNFRFSKPPKERRDLKKGRWSGVLFRSCGGGHGRGFGFDPGAQFPQEGAKLPGDGDLDLVVVNPAFGQCLEPGVEAQLGVPGKLQDPAGLFGLAAGELFADFGWEAVVGGLLDEQPAGVRVSTFADAALLLSSAAGVFGGDEAEEGHELLGMLEAAEGTDFRDGDHGCDELEAFEGHHGFDQGFALPAF